jgi:replicative DNA helicase
VYNPDTEEKEMAEILVRKHRNGPIGDRHLRFIERYSRFEDLGQEVDGAGGSIPSESRQKVS